MKTGKIMMCLLAMFLVGCNKYQVLESLSSEAHTLTQEQRSTEVLKGFLVMQPGVAVDSMGIRKLYTTEDLEKLVSNTDFAVAMLGHVGHDDVFFGMFENFRVEDGEIVADLALDPVDEYNRKLADGVRVLYFRYPHRAQLSAGLVGDMIIEVSFVQSGAATDRLLK